MHDKVKSLLANAPLDLNELARLLLNGVVSRNFFYTSVSATDSFKPSRETQETLFHILAKKGALPTMLNSLYDHFGSIAVREKLIRDTGDIAYKTKATNDALMNLIRDQLDKDGKSPLMLAFEYGGDSISSPNKLQAISLLAKNILKISKHIGLDVNSDEVKGQIPIVKFLELFEDDFITILSLRNHREAAGQIHRMLYILNKPEDFESTLDVVRTLFGIPTRLEAKTAQSYILREIGLKYLLNELKGLEVADFFKVDCAHESINTFFTTGERPVKEQLASSSQAPLEAQAAASSQATVQVPGGFVEYLDELRKDIATSEYQEWFRDVLGENYKEIHVMIALAFQESEDGIFTQLLEHIATTLNCEALTLERFINLYMSVLTYDELKIVNKNGHNAFEMASVRNMDFFVKALFPKYIEFGIYKVGMDFYWSAISTHSEEVLQYLLQEQKLIAVDWAKVLKLSFKHSDSFSVECFKESDVGAIKDTTDGAKVAEEGKYNQLNIALQYVYQLLGYMSVGNELLQRRSAPEKVKLINDVLAATEVKILRLLDNISKLEEGQKLDYALDNPVVLKQTLKLMVNIVKQIPHIGGKKCESIHTSYQGLQIKLSDQCLKSDQLSADMRDAFELLKSGDDIPDDASAMTAVSNMSALDGLLDMIGGDEASSSLHPTSAHVDRAPTQLSGDSGAHTDDA